MKNEQRKGLKNGRCSVPASSLLIYLLVCTLLVTGVSFSRYITSTGGSDSARVAKGVVTVSYDDDTTVQLVRPANDGVLTEEFSFQLTNSISEVAIQYDVVVTLDKSLREGLSMTLDGKTGTVKNEGKEYEFSNMGTFGAGVNSTIAHTLSFSGDFDTISPGTDDTYYIQITIRSQQID